MRRRLLTAALLLVTTPAWAVTYCCSDANSRQVCADILPAVCYGKAYREISDNGVVKQVGPPPTAEQRARDEAERLRKIEEERQAKEQARRDQVLVDKYGSERDIDIARERVLSDIGAALQQDRVLLAEALKRQKQLALEAEPYKGRPLPLKLRNDTRENEEILASLRATITERQTQSDGARVRFEEEKRRFAELMAKRRNSSAR